MKSEAVVRLRKLRVLDSSRDPEHEVEVSLVELAGDPGFRFPEPDGKTDRWREHSITMLVDTVRGTARRITTTGKTPLRMWRTFLTSQAMGGPTSMTKSPTRMRTRPTTGRVVGLDVAASIRSSR